MCKRLLNIQHEAEQWQAMLDEDGDGMLAVLDTERETRRVAEAQAQMEIGRGR